MSAEEIRFGIDAGLIDGWPMVQVRRPVGTWERAGISQLRRPSLWEGLL